MRTKQIHIVALAQAWAVVGKYGEGRGSVSSAIRKASKAGMATAKEILFGVAVRVLAVPLPGRPHDVFEAGKLRRPTEVSLRLRGRCYKFRRIPGAAWFFNDRDFALRNFLAGRHNFPNRIAV